MIVNKNIFTQLRDEPLVVFYRRQVIILADEKTRRNRDIAKWNLRGIESAVLLHVHDATEVISKQFFHGLDCLSVVDYVLVAAARREVLHEHVVAFHVVHVDVRVSEPFDRFFTGNLELVTEDLQRLLFSPVGVKQVEGPCLLCKPLDLPPVL